MRSETILTGRGREIAHIPRWQWQQKLAAVPHYFRDKLSFMTAEHHRVRYFVVRELPMAGQPLSSEFIARHLGLPVSRVIAILDDLERNLTFLYRNRKGMVSWAYPVTVDETPHALAFSTGESIFAA